MELRKEKRTCLYELGMGKETYSYEIGNKKGNQFDEIEPVHMELKMRKGISLMKLNLFVWN